MHQGVKSALQAADGAPPTRQPVKGTFRHPPRLHGVRAAIKGGAGEEDDDDNCGVAGHGHADSAKAPPSLEVLRMRKWGILCAANLGIKMETGSLFLKYRFILLFLAKSLLPDTCRFGNEGRQRLLRGEAIAESCRKCPWHLQDSRCASG